MATLQHVASDAFRVPIETATNRFIITYGDLATQNGTSAYFILPRALDHIWSWCDYHGYPHNQRACRLAEDRHPGLRTGPTITR